MKCPMNDGERSFVGGAPNCPRCGCSNTKFCYYNNYSLTQPRFFCKGCRRYWTKGGSLRDVPVGGGCRKNRRRVTTTTAKSLRMSSNGSIGNHVMIKSSPSSSMLHDDGSHIDMALVYANFLGKKNPDLSKSGIDISNNNNNHNHNGSQVHGLLGVDDDHFDPCFIGSDDFGLLLCPHYYYNNNDLPEPLLWSSSQNLVVSQTAMQASREEDPLLVGPHEDEENLLLNGSWSAFDLTSSDHTFLRRA